ncbi:hypothetical protein AB0J35_62325 [Nonomuraea angiospora]|uniref:hypothetical protein n=1 Tax=Nonomuraea TaxID=83681 RepID=UPI003415EC17
MNMHHDDERPDETADLPPLPPKPALKHDNDGKVPLPPLPPESVLRRCNDGKSRRPPPSDKLVFGLAVQPDAPTVLSEPLLKSDPAD